MIGFRNPLRAFVTFCLWLGMASGAACQSYPSRPITLIVPLGPGGSTDIIARTVAEGMGAILGQPIIVENSTGAGGTIGVGRLARATPDGYTIGIGQWGTHVANGVTYRLGYDVVKDFEPIGLIATQPFLIDARKSVPASDLQELITWLRSNADTAAQGNSGVGTPSYVAGLLFQNAIGVHIPMVPYRGAGESMQGMVAGHIDIMLDTPAVAMAQVRGGTINSFAVTAKTRLAIAPSIPTTDEAGLPGFYFSFWHALWAPKDTPKDVIAKLNDAMTKVLSDPIIGQKLMDLGQELFPCEQQTPEALAAYQKMEIEKWWAIIKAMNIAVRHDG
jgi:tripartite-type tricarboxylate transporter receptor subunit TctC